MREAKANPAAARMEITTVMLDNEGRPSGVEGGIRYDFRRFEGLFSECSESLLKDCSTVFGEGAVCEQERRSKQRTFFLPARGAEPMCELERLAKSIYEFHTKDAKGVDNSKSGVEWWVQIEDGREDIVPHFIRGCRTEVNIHPHLVTFTYLTDVGAPTVVLDLKPARTAIGASGCDCAISDGFLSFPKMGAHVSFDGGLVYCTPAQLFPREQPTESVGHGVAAAKTRATLVVAIWLNHQPTHTKRFKRKLTTPLGTTRFEPGDSTPIGNGELPLAECDSTHGEHNVSLEQRSRTIDLRMNMNLSKLERARHGAVKLRFDRSACQLTIRNRVARADEDRQQDEEGVEEDGIVEVRGPFGLIVGYELTLPESKVIGWEACEAA